MYLWLMLNLFAASTDECPPGKTRTCISWNQQCHDETVCDETDADGNCLRSHTVPVCGTVCLEWACQ